MRGSVELFGYDTGVHGSMYGIWGGGGCDAGSAGCVATSNNKSNFTESVLTFYAQANTPYYVVVDGYGTDSSAYQLAADCP